MLEEGKLKVESVGELHYYLSEGGHSKWIIGVHGLGEHSMRHQYVDREFSSFSNILFFDLPGHGKSSGTKGDIENFDHYCLSLVAIIKFLQKSYQMRSYLLFGHSMGGLIVWRTLKNYLRNDSSIMYPSYVYLSSPCVYPFGKLADLLQQSPINVISFLAKQKWSLLMRGVVDRKLLSHDPEVWESYDRDPLVLHDLYSRLIFKLLDACNDTFKDALHLPVPLFVAIGSEDKVVDSQKVQNYFTQVETGAKLYVQDEGRHELHNEIHKIQESYFQFLKKSFYQYITKTN
jgi:alpha-beta hydrolase superfamily lysophospholipase